MIATAIVAVFRAISSNLLMRVLRGWGDNKFVFLMIRSDEVLKSIAGVIRIFKYKWIKNITRDIR